MAVIRFFNAAYKRAGIQEFHFHDLRHTTATMVYGATRDIRIVKEILWHSRIDQTMKYSHFFQNHEREALEKTFNKFFNFSLRKMEQVFDRLTLFVKQISLGSEIFSPDLAVFLICLHEGDIKIFDRVRKIQNCSKSIWEELFETAVSSVAYQIYKDEAFSKFKKINRKIAPEVIPVAAYSYLMQQGNGYRIIQDNVDRFYISSPDVWLFQHDAINTYDVLKNRDFDKEQFKESYCKHIDFISHFE